MDLAPIEQLGGLREASLGRFRGFVYEEGEAFAFPGPAVEAEGALFDLAEPGEELEERIAMGVLGQIPDVNLTIRDSRTYLVGLASKQGGGS
jgi:hypothetical protein